MYLLILSEFLEIAVGIQVKRRSNVNVQQFCIEEIQEVKRQKIGENDVWMCLNLLLKLEKEPMDR